MAGTPALAGELASGEGGDGALHFLGTSDREPPAVPSGFLAVFGGIGIF
jgi:hypothetical protein